MESLSLPLHLTFLHSFRHCRTIPASLHDVDCYTPIQYPDRRFWSRHMRSDLWNRYGIMVWKFPVGSPSADLLHSLTQFFLHLLAQFRSPNHDRLVAGVGFGCQSEGQDILAYGGAFTLCGRPVGRRHHLFADFLG